MKQAQYNPGVPLLYKDRLVTWQIIDKLAAKIWWSTKIERLWWFIPIDTGLIIEFTGKKKKSRDQPFWKLLEQDCYKLYCLFLSAEAVSFNGCLFFSSTNSFSFDLVLLVQFKFAEIPLRQCSSPLNPPPPSPISVSNLTLISFPWWWFQVKTKALIDYQTIGRLF